ncbi:hypothetical protein ABT033_01395 [Streptomyces pharetrae]|uniref:hypothetical protein n=1 Tax=Streptomyces pharetrae TaxID=291370 RepID=UPI003348339A
MSGGDRYWNEETQRWEDGTQGEAHVTPPPPARPDHEPRSAGVADTSPAVPWPDPVRPSAPIVPGSRQRPRVWASVVAAAALIGVTVALVVVQVNDGDEPGRRTGPRADGTVSPTPSPETYPSESPQEETTALSSPSASSRELPAGYESFVDPQGFRIAMPVGWTREAVPSEYGIDVVNYRSPTGERRLQVFEVAEATAQESFELLLSPQTPKAPGFEQLAMYDLTGVDVTGASLEYLVDAIRGEPDVGAWHVVDARFEASDGDRYAIIAYGRDDDGRDDEFELASTGVEWFCPPEWTCDAQ